MKILLLLPMFSFVVHAGECPKIQRAEQVQHMTIDQIREDGPLSLKLAPDLSRIVGYRFGSLKPCGIFESMGFREGDVLIQVNDTPTQSPVGGLLFFNSIHGTQPFTVKVLRDDQTVTFTVD